MDDLKLIALDAEDLAVVSAHLQDAVLKVADLAYLPEEKRFAAVANRFNWSKAGDDGEAKSQSQSKFKSKPKPQSLERRRCAMRFERVLGAQLSGIKLNARRDVLSLLAISFEEGEAPGGHVTLHFSGGGAIRLEVECIEAELRDLGGTWAAKSKPTHPEG